MSETRPEKMTPADSLESYAKYPFDSDETYKQGLESLLKDGLIDPNQPAALQEEALRRTRVFYYNSITGCKVSVDDAREYEFSLRDTNNINPASSTLQPASHTDESPVLGFAELQELIESGKMDRIPHNKVISDALNDGPPSESIAPMRKKPWE